MKKNLTRFAQNQFGRLWLLLVYLFLYIPLLFLIVFSFNSTRQDGIFTGFSLRWYAALLMLVMLPFWTSFLLRVYAWKGILDDQGVLNNLLLATGIIQEPLQIDRKSVV